jgi:hypothetical protein
MSNILGKQKIKKLQKTVALGIAHILQNVQDIFHVCNNITYNLETWFVSGM